jgi:putative flippase GtrA
MKRLFFIAMVCGAVMLGGCMETTYQNKKIKELILVFLVSAAGLLLNLLLMYLFVTVLGLDTHIQKTMSKIAATGIVFFWNFLSRKYWIYNNK